MSKPKNEISLTPRKSVPFSGLLVDLKNPDVYLHNEHHAVFADLRTEQPVYWNPESDSTGFWAVTRYDDAIRVVQDPATFSAAVENGGMRIFNIQDVSLEPRSHLLSMDPPQHTELRRALQPLFATKRIVELEGIIRHRMRQLVDRISDRCQIEFVSSIAAPLTLGLLTNLLDVPEADASKLLRWSNAFVGDDDNDYQESAQYRKLCVAEMDDYATQLWLQRGGGAGQDFVSLISWAKLDGRTIDLETYLQNFGIFLIGANETTRHSLSAGILALTMFPAEKEKLVADRSLIDSAVKEIVRWASPLMHVRRTAMRDVELGGRVIKKGDKVVVWYNSANRDESKWISPMKFDVARFHAGDAAAHLAFGHGPHYCMGWRMAELQLKIALEEILARLPDIHACEPVRLLRSNFIGGIKELHVAFTPEARN
jgi:linalool 8-monooxygenase